MGFRSKLLSSWQTFPFHLGGIRTPQCFLLCCHDSIVDSTLTMVSMSLMWLSEQWPLQMSTRKTAKHIRKHRSGEVRFLVNENDRHPGAFLLNSDINFDIRELLQRFTIMYSNGLSGSPHQAQILCRVYIASTQHVPQANICLDLFLHRYNLERAILLGWPNTKLLTTCFPRQWATLLWRKNQVGASRRGLADR